MEKCKNLASTLATTAAGRVVSHPKSGEIIGTFTNMMTPTIMIAQNQLIHGVSSASTMPIATVKPTKLEKNQPNSRFRRQV